MLRLLNCMDTDFAGINSQTLIKFIHKRLITRGMKYEGLWLNYLSNHKRWTYSCSVFRNTINTNGKTKQQRTKLERHACIGREQGPYCLDISINMSCFIEASSSIFHDITSYDCSMPCKTVSMIIEK